jgi:acyl-CoA synthetase (AMP-forming)/AMP-acid ligase II
MNVIELVRRHAEAFPGRVALVEGTAENGRSITFAQLEDAAADAAALLAANGVRAGDTVLVFQPMSIELYVALNAIFRLGAVAMFVDPSFGRQHIESCCALSPPKALIASMKGHLLRLLSPAIRRIPVRFVIGGGVPGAMRWAAANRMLPRPDVESVCTTAPALITFTSGSTGTPKAAVRTHGFLAVQYRVLEERLRYGSGEVNLVSLPIVLFANLASGITSVIPAGDLRRPAAISSEPVLEQARALGVTSLIAPPAFMERLAQHSAERGWVVPGVRSMFVGGGPVFPRLLDQMQRMAPTAEIIAVYGSTEAEPIAEVSHREVRQEDFTAMYSGRGLLAGRPVEQIRLAILPDRWGQPIAPYPMESAFEADMLPPGRSGEIVVTGEHVLSGYLQGLGDEETKFRVGTAVWHRTGDAGYLDEQGRLWLLGRCSARIEDQHGILYPFAVECAAYRDLSIRRAAAIAHQGRRLLLVEPYERSPAPDPCRLRESLAWARLDSIRVVRSIPVDKRHNTKVDYGALRRML